jgi:hypothetical protein
MSIGLVDVDSHNFPNLALMKISAWHKQQGDNVEWIFPLNKYSKVYMSKVFDFSADYNTYIHADEIIKGGRAYDKALKLPDCMESVYPDYGLYNIQNKAYGYLTRGCPRACEFCDVVNLEGRQSYKVANLEQFWRGQKEIVLLDPNLLACKEWKELLQQLIDSKAWVDFTQGLDIRLMTDEKAEMINKLKVKMLHFAWDDPKQDLTKQFKDYKKISKFDFRKLRVYVLVNYWSTLGEDLHRIYTLRELGYDPYVMIYDKDNAPKEIKRMARWVNNKFIFRCCEKFEDYQKGGDT